MITKNYTLAQNGIFKIIGYRIISYSYDDITSNNRYNLFIYFKQLKL